MKRLFTSESVTEGHPDKNMWPNFGCSFRQYISKGSNGKSCLWNSSNNRNGTSNGGNINILLCRYLLIVRNTIKEIGYDRANMDLIVILVQY